MKKLIRLLTNKEPHGFVKLIVNSEYNDLKVDIIFTESIEDNDLEYTIIDYMTRHNKSYFILDGRIESLSNNRILVTGSNLVLELPYASSKVLQKDPKENQYIMLLELDKNVNLILKDIVSISVWDILRQAKDVIAENQRKDKQVKAEIVEILEETWPYIIGAVIILVLTIWYLFRGIHSVI
jgi:hypothetical protein